MLLVAPQQVRDVDVAHLPLPAVHLLHHGIAADVAAGVHTGVHQLRQVGFRRGNGDDDVVNRVLLDVVSDFPRIHHHADTPDAGVAPALVVIHHNHRHAVAIAPRLHIADDLRAAPAAADDHHAPCLGAAAGEEVRPSAALRDLDDEPACRKHHHQQQPLHKVDRARHEEDVRFAANRIAQERHEIRYPRAAERTAGDLQQQIHARVFEDAAVEAHHMQKRDGGDNQQRQTAPDVEDMRCRGVHVIIHLQTHQQRSRNQQRVQEHEQPNAHGLIGENGFFLQSGSSSFAIFPNAAKIDMFRASSSL